jgi:class 3 adenylate cyclase
MLTHRLSPHPEERRLVTVLFADLMNFTHLAESLDPEETGDLLNRLWATLDAIVTRHGGRVDKHLGDSLMAVWGAPRATEDDAERAVTCGLALQRELHALNEELRRSEYAELHMRVGINSGAVVTAIIDSTGEYSVIGDVVNVAQRLQGIAPPDGVVIGAGAYRLTRDIFRVQPLPPQEVRGKTAPVEAFLVLGPETQPVRVRYRTADSLEMRLVGRDVEMVRLQEIHDRVNTTRQPHLVLLSGEAGIGKSRLVYEFSRRIELRARRGLILSARAVAEHATQPYFLWESLWAVRLGVMKDEPESARREKFTHGLLEVWGTAPGPMPSAEATHVLGYLIGLDWPDSPYLASLRNDPAAVQARATELATDLFQRASADGPVVLILDDLQFADTASLDLFDAFLGAKDLPLLIVTASRLGPQHLRPAWVERPNFMHLTLGRMTLTEDIVAAIFPRAATLPRTFLRRLAAGAEGNPYFLEERVKMLLQTGVIVSREEGWQWAGDQPPDAVPLSDSLRAQLQARLDALSPQARAVVLAASVIGRTFWIGVVEALLRRTTITKLLTPPPDGNWYSPLSEALDELQRQELVFERRGSSLIGEREFIFKHNLLRETAYELLPKKFRLQYHALVAEWLAKRETSDYALAIAEHYSRAGKAVQASRFYQLAADHLRERGYMREANAAAKAAMAAAR